jgi:transposase
MTPLYARAPSGQRAYGQVPRNRGSNISLLASLSKEGMKAAMTLDGSVDGPAFDAYVEQLLLPTLQAGQTVILDNLKVHKSAKALALIKQAGCQVQYLPSYSPDLNPIESAFSKIKTLLHQAKARSRQLLDAAIASALTAITPHDAKGFFARAGYHFSVQ